MADDPSGLPIRLEKMITRQRGSSMGSVSYRVNGGEDGYEMFSIVMGSSTQNT